MKRFSLSRALLVATLVIQVTSCASTQEPDPPGIQGPVFYTVKQDDRLGDIAYALTGSTDNWVVIADHNNVKDARKIRVGDVLEIPLTLIPDGRSDSQADVGTVAINSSENDYAVQKASSESNAEDGLIQAPVTSDNVSSRPSDINVVLSPVNINRQFQLSEMKVDVSPDPAATASSAKVRVVGTYFPKGLYAQPTESARLITRVAPGTTFDLDTNLDGWYRIRFGDDVAFLRAIDGKIFFPDKPKILRSAEANE